jgi:hypothetical protein
VYEDLRGLGIRKNLGPACFSGPWKERKSGTEWGGPCPAHNAKTNRSSFSFDPEGRYQCFSCRIKGRGASDLTMSVRKVGFKDAVNWLQSRPVSDGSVKSECPSKQRPETSPPEPTALSSLETLHSAERTRNTTSSRNGSPNARFCQLRLRDTAWASMTTPNGKAPTRARLCSL